MGLALTVLGGVRIEGDAGPLQGRAAQRRRLALLALLAAAPERAARRESLVRVLWPDSPEDAGRRLLTESLHVFRRELHEEVVLTAGEEVRLNPQVLRCDLADFRAAMSRGDWRAAADAYAGPFLEGFEADDMAAFARWVEATRAEIGREYARALEALAARSEEEGDAAGAAEWWGRLAVHDPYGSGVAMRLMETLARAGERARAVRFATAYAARLREELEIEPDPRILELAARLRTDAAPAPDVPRAAGPSPRTPAEAAGGEEAQLTPEFEVLRPIGEGTVATVYLAREPALGRLVALKVLAERFARDPTAQLRFEREARAAARVQHPNVAAVFRTGRTTGGAPFLVLPYVAGGSLEDRVAAAGRLSQAEVRRYVAQAAAGLAAAHRLGIVHRDVRPANLLYDRDTDRVLLTDFGLVAVLETGLAAESRLTRPGEILGTPAYASPEQLQGQPVTDRADVYSLGIVAFELLAGRSPYDARTPLEMTMAHARQAPKRLSELRGDIDPALDDLVHRCLNKRPEQRPFAAEVSEALGWA